MSFMVVEAALQEVQEALDVERSEAAARLEAAERAKNIQPYRSELQLDHPCCNCGILIAKGWITVMCHLPMHLGQWLTSEYITWCDKCWRENFGAFLPKDQVEDRTLGK